MKIRIFVYLIFLTSTLSAQNGQALHSVIEALFKREGRIDSNYVTGFIIGCIDHDSTWIFPYGRTFKGYNTQPNAETVFEIGSISQSFMATILYKNVQKGLFDYNSVVNTYLPTHYQFPAGDKITLLELVTHTSGLPKFPTDLGASEMDKEQPFENYTEGSLFDFLKGIDTATLSSGKYRHAPLNYAILEKILEKYMPTSMAYKRENEAQGYNLAQKPVEIWRFKETFSASMGQKATIQQILNHVKDNIHMNELHVPIFPTDINKYTFVGKAWRIVKQNKNTTICLATGATGGHSAFAAFVPQTQTGVVVLTNSRFIPSKLGVLVLRVLNQNWKRKS